jgi:hypothetical protein
MKRKKLLIAGGALALVFLAALLGYLFFVNRDSGGSVLGTIQQFFPTESGEQTPIEEISALSQDMGSGGTEASQESAVTLLEQVSATPSAGGVILERDGEFAVRFTEQETGHTFERYVGRGEVERITNTTIPRIEEAMWFPEGNQVILRYLADDRETIETFRAEITEGQDGGELVGAFLPPNIAELVVAPSGERLFYIQPTPNGVQGVSETLLGARSIIFNHPLTEWSARYISNQSLALSTRPSGIALGQLMILRENTGATETVLKNIAGLSARISPDETYAILSESGDNAPGLFLKALNDDEAAIDLSLNTLAEKCVWSEAESSVAICAVPKIVPPGTYPDAWYQGKVLFNDQLWKIDVESGEVELIADLETSAREPIDATDLVLSADGRFILLTNKRDSTLWGILLREEEEMQEAGSQ